MLDKPVTIDRERFFGLRPCTGGRGLFEQHQVDGVIKTTPRQIMLSDEARSYYSWLARRGFVPQVIDGLAVVDQTLKYIDLSHIEISYSAFTNVLANVAHFKCATLKHCTLTNVNLTRANLRQVDTGSVTFIDCNLYDTCFTSMNAQNTRFHNCNLGTAVFSYSIFNDCEFLSCRSSASSPQFERAYFAFSTFVNCDLQKANFRFADLSTTEFINCNLNGTNFTGAILSKDTLARSESAGSVTTDAFFF